MKIGNLVQWFLVNILGRKPAPIEPRVFPSLLEGGGDACCDDDETCCKDDADAYTALCREDPEWHLPEADELVSVKIPKVSKKTKKAAKPKKKSVKAKKPVGKKAKK